MSDFKTIHAEFFSAQNLKNVQRVIEELHPEVHVDPMLIMSVMKTLWTNKEYEIRMDDNAGFDIDVTDLKDNLNVAVIVQISRISKHEDAHNEAYRALVSNDFRPPTSEMKPILQLAPCKETKVVESRLPGTRLTLMPQNVCRESTNATLEARDESLRDADLFQSQQSFAPTRGLKLGE